MLKCRVPRVLVTGLLLAVGVAGLAGCRTSPTVAAYVGEEQISTAELESAVHQRKADADIAAYAQGHGDEFTRRVLSLLVQEQVYAAVSKRYDVHVDDTAVRDRIDELLGGQDPQAVYTDLAKQGISRADVFENVRQQLVRQEVAVAEGKAEGVSDAALQARYDKNRDSLAQVSFGYVTVPDQATADAVLAQLTADPAAYATVAAAHPGPYTLPALENRSPDQLPGPLAQGITAAAPNTGFTLAIPETGGVVVTFVAGTVYPTFAEVRGDLAKQAADEADQAGSKLVDGVRNGLDVTVNPRYGVLDKNNLVPATGGVVDILAGKAAGGA